VSSTGAPPEHLDVLVVGAGISGIGAARYLRTEHPGKTFAVLEARASFGGTWDLFRYPGIRSDSDLYTFGYDFKPWKDKQSIASGDRILSYLRETLDENHIGDHIRYHHRVVSADWSSESARWNVVVERTDTGDQVQLTAGWLFSAGGYYRYDEGYTPQFAGRERFQGQVVHPQHWPADLDHAGKRVVVIGSGATAVTLVPALAEQAAHVTMLQRTPSYILPVPREDPIAQLLARYLPEQRAFALARRKNIAFSRWSLVFCQRYPKAARALLRRLNVTRLPAGYAVDEHFNPPYNPWEQRLCVVPDGDLFREISNGRASVVTQRITTFTEDGVLLENGTQLDADIIVTATGLTIQVAGGIALSVDGKPVSYPDTVVYRGLMLSGIPNFSMTIGYTNSSWTLKIGLLCEYFCRLLSYMDEHGHDTAWVDADPDMPRRPLLDFGAGYVQRSLDSLPRQGPAAPWVMSRDFVTDCKLLRRPEVTDEHLQFSGPETRAARAATAATTAV
jgi:cation diffusion facilitator CzcD-associated flavoprotein CzcO